MNLKFKNSKYFDLTTNKFSTNRDFRLNSGAIIFEQIDDSQYDFSDVTIFPSFMDLAVGYKGSNAPYGESSDILTKAAISGGYGIIAVLPDCDPKITDEVTLRNFYADFSCEPIQVLPIAQMNNGKDLCNVFGMQELGCRFFINEKDTSLACGLIDRIQWYFSSMKDVILFYRCNQFEFNEHNQLAFGTKSLNLGLPGFREIEEYIQFYQIIEFDKSNNKSKSSRPILTHISTKQSADIAVKEGLNAGIPIANLIFEDKDIGDFDFQFKLDPPLRDEETRKYLIDKVLSDNRFFITSNHQPTTMEQKSLEFCNSAFGTCSIEYILPILRSKYPEILLENWIEILSLRPRIITNTTINNIDSWVVYDENENWIADRESQISNSFGNSFLNQNMVGRVKAMIFKDCIVKNKS